MRSCSCSCSSPAAHYPLHCSDCSTSLVVQHVQLSSCPYTKLQLHFNNSAPTVQQLNNCSSAVACKLCPYARLHLSSVAVKQLPRCAVAIANQQLQLSRCSPTGAYKLPRCEAAVAYAKLVAVPAQQLHTSSSTPQVKDGANPPL